MLHIFFIIHRQATGKITRFPTKRSLQFQWNNLDRYGLIYHENQYELVSQRSTTRPCAPRLENIVHTCIKHGEHLLLLHIRLMSLGNRHPYYMAIRYCSRSILSCDCSQNIFQIQVFDQCHSGICVANDQHRLLHSDVLWFRVDSGMRLFTKYMSNTYTPPMSFRVVTDCHRIFLADPIRFCYDSCARLCTTHIFVGI